MRILLATDRRI